MRENRMSGSEGGGAKPIVSPYPYMPPPAPQASEQLMCEIPATA